MRLIQLYGSDRCSTSTFYSQLSDTYPTLSCIRCNAYDSLVLSSLHVSGPQKASGTTPKSSGRALMTVVYHPTLFNVLSGLVVSSLSWHRSTADPQESPPQSTVILASVDILSTRLLLASYSCRPSPACPTV